MATTQRRFESWVRYRNPSEQTLSTQAIILGGIALYVMFMLAVGILVAGRSAWLNDFAVTNRTMSLAMCSISIIATWFGSGPMMGSAAAAYAGNTLEVLRDPFVSGVSLLVAGFFFVRTYRHSRRYTPIEFHETRIGNFAGVRHGNFGQPFAARRQESVRASQA